MYVIILYICIYIYLVYVCFFPYSISVYFISLGKEPGNKKTYVNLMLTIKELNTLLITF